MNKYPISAVCPRCSRSDAWRRKWSFGTLQVCRACRACYVLPSPRWERVVSAGIFLVGALLFGLMAFGIRMLASEARANDVGTTYRINTCSGVVALAAFFCLAQMIRELRRLRRGRPARRDAEAGGAALEEAPGGAAGAPPLVPPDQAEALVRAVAERHEVRGVLRRLGAIPANHLANMAAHFAHEMEADETPLVRIDLSLLRNGKRGLLVTNRGLYSSWLPRAIWLREIEQVSYVPAYSTGYRGAVTARQLAHVLFHGAGHAQNQLRVNGEVVYSSGDPLRAEFWGELLTALAAAAREARPSPPDAAPRLAVLETVVARGDDQPPEVRRIRNPQWQEVEESIRDLHPRSRPSVRLWAGEPEEGLALDILGGHGKYALREPGDGWVYYDPSRGEEAVEVCTGRAAYRCPAFYVCTDLHRVLEIARHFAETRTLD